MHVEWTRRFSEAVRPFASGAVYVNNLGDKGDERVRSAYGPSEYERLVLLKNTYDPDNVLRLNQNIRPKAHISGRQPARAVGNHQEAATQLE